MNKQEIQKKEESKKTEIVVLDYGTIFLRRDEEGKLLNPFHQKIILSEARGHLYKMYDSQAKKDRYEITSTGFIQLNKIASINIVTPQTIVVDGLEKPNPYVERNLRTKSIEHVNVRKIGIGFSPVGNICIIDKSLYFNVRTYFVQSIQSKMKKRKWKGGELTDELQHPNLAKIGTKDDKMKEGSWAWYEIEEPLGIWLNYDDPGAKAILDDHTQRQRFADRIAQKIVERNILKDHPAIGASRPEVFEEKKDHKAWVMAYGWRHSMKTEDINRLMIESDKHADVEVKAEVIEPKPEEEKQVIDEEKGENGTDPAMGDPSKDKEPPQAFFDKKKKEEEKEKKG